MDNRLILGSANFAVVFAVLAFGASAAGSMPKDAASAGTVIAVGHPNRSMSPLATSMEPMQESSVSVTVSPTTGKPGDQVTVLFTLANPDVVIDTCAAAFDGLPWNDNCTISTTEVSVELNVPEESPGSTSINWKFTGHLKSDGTTGKGQYFVPFTILPPDFSVTASPASGRPGDSVTVSLTPTDPDVGIDECAVAIGTAPGKCSPSETGGSAAVTIPSDAKPESTFIEGELSFYFITSQNGGGANREVPYAILPPNNSGSPPSDSQYSNFNTQSPNSNQPNVILPQR